ncbi:uncharacterized protein LOC135093562 [Scylla paramamosain]|uniref:uncharacterized protein LOC135093562 n=1 Tax=Scylla paramamosain TaxID=85552 RepID=UPI003083C414
MRQLWRVATLLLLQWLEVTATTTSAASGQSSPSIFPTFMTHARQTKHTRHIHLTHTLDEAGSSLSAALLTLISRELASCSLVVAADAKYITSPVLHALACLPNQKQVVSVAGGWEKAGRRVMWQAPGCRAYIFLLHQAGVLLSHSNAAPSSWDYAGRYVFVGLTREDLVALTLTHKGRKTEHLVGIVQVRLTIIVLDLLVRFAAFPPYFMMKVLITKSLFLGPPSEVVHHASERDIIAAQRKLDKKTQLSHTW